MINVIRLSHLVRSQPECGRTGALRNLSHRSSACLPRCFAISFMLVCNFLQFDEIKPVIWPICCVQVLPTTFFCISFRTRAKSVPLALVMSTAFELFLYQCTEGYIFDQTFRNFSCGTEKCKLTFFQCMLQLVIKGIICLYDLLLVKCSSKKSKVKSSKRTNLINFHLKFFKST